MTLTDGQPISVAPECELLVRVLRRDSKRQEVLEIKDALAAVDLEWFYFQLDRHGVTPLAAANLLGIGCDVLPLEILCRLRRASFDYAKRGLFLTGRLLQLLDLFQSAGIPVIPLKGPVLAQVLYDDATMRQFVDLDLLVHRQNVPRAIQALRHEGYMLDSHFAWVRQETLIDLCCELTFSRKCGARVDLHWELAPSDYPFRFDAEVLWSSLRSIRIAGRDVPALSPECLLLFLCMHGAKHLWTRLQWICDVARLVQISPEMDWAHVFKLAGSNGGEHVVLLGLSLAHECLDAPLPGEILRRIDKNRVIPPLVAQVGRRLFQTAPAPPSSLERTLFNVKMARRLWDKIRHFAALLKAPTEADARLLRLPRKLFFLYYPFRIWRLSAKYSARPIRGHAGWRPEPAIELTKPGP